MTPRQATTAQASARGSGAGGARPFPVRLVALSMWALATALPLGLLWNEAVRSGVLPPSRPVPMQVPAWMDLGAAPAEFDPEYACAGGRLGDPLSVRIEEGHLSARAYESAYEPRQDDLPYAVDFTDAIQQPPPVPGEVGVPGRETWAITYAREHAQLLVHNVVDGSLIGFDGGEYGGSLWWYPRAPGPGVKLSDQNVQSIVVWPGATSAVVFVGLSHMGLVSGQALRVARDDSDGRWRVTDAHEFRGTPEAHVMVPEGMLVATTRSVERLPTVGKPVVLYDAGGLHLGTPLSLVVANTGEIAVGMRHFVLILRPGADGYAARWYVPFPCGVDDLLLSIGAND